VISLGSLVGVITVLGISAQRHHAIQHFRHLEEVEGGGLGVGLVLRGAGERLAPILMTSLCRGGACRW
jgi:Cu/Ag efflux pump CusA